MDRVSDVMGLVAGIGGIVVLAFAWPRRQVVTARRRHPSAVPPFRLTHHAAHWRVAVRDGGPPVAIDILTHRPTGSGDWFSEPIVHPVVVAPGTVVVIPSTVEDPTGVHDVVVAWTVRHPSGDVQGSRSMTVGAPVAVDVIPPSDSTGLGTKVAYGAIGILLAFVSAVVGLGLFDEGRTNRRDPAAVATAEPAVRTDAPVAGSTIVAPTLGTRPQPVSAAGPAPTEPTSTIAVTTQAAPEPQASPSTSTSARPTTVPERGALTTDGDGRRVRVEARVENCRFGADCVIASFTLDGFDPSGEYVCEFGDGSRFTFRYVGEGADDACSTGGPNPSITIEVDGVRSATVTRDQPDGL